MNDIVEIFDDVISCKLFADDLKLYTVIKSTTLISPLTAAIDCLCVWSAMWQLKINIEKCILVHMGSINSIFNYSLNGSQLKSSLHVRDLGVEIDSSLPAYQLTHPQTSTTLKAATKCRSSRFSIGPLPILLPLITYFALLIGIRCSDLISPVTISGPSLKKLFGLSFIYMFFRN